MSKTSVAGASSSWLLDQMAKSTFFHQRIHDWGVMEVADAVGQVRGENLEWELKTLGVSAAAWKRVIHRGIPPVVVFAHPSVLQTVPRAVAYYRMLAMVSQKSMSRIGLVVTAFESGARAPDVAAATALAVHLNRIISSLVEADQTLDAREFDIWRGMAAGSQAQGSWQNAKGAQVEELVKAAVRQRISERGLVAVADAGTPALKLKDGREVFFGDEPDVSFRRRGKLLAAMEVKGGIDAAGVLERIGAAVKSLSRAREENPGSQTISLLQGVSLTETARHDLGINRQSVTNWFAIEDFLQDEGVREEVFELLGI